MKVAVKNPNNKPVNISKLAPLMPVQTLRGNQEIEVNVRDINNVMEKAIKIGVTVTPVEAFEVTPVVEQEIKVDTPSLEEVEVSEPVLEDIIETPIETNEVVPETVEPSIDNTVVDVIETKPKRKTKVKEDKPKKARKSTKKSTTKSE